MSTVPIPDRLHQRIVVTGGSGFLGRHVMSELSDRGYANVVAPTHDEYDLTSEGDVVALLHDTKPDVVIHLAAVVGGIGANRDRPGEFFYKNLVMGAHLMEHARRIGVNKFVAIGTICAYPRITPVPFREESLWDGYPEETNAPYGLAKKMMLVQAQAYRQQFGFNSIFLLPTNLYGPGDNFDPASSHVIPALIRKCIEAREENRPEVEVWGTGTPTREFLYAADCADGVVDALERYNDPEPVNLGSGVEISIRELTSLITAATGYTGKVRFNPRQPDGQPRRRLDTSRAATSFGWHAKTSFPDGLKATVDWYTAHRAARLVAA